MSSPIPTSINHPPRPGKSVVDLLGDLGTIRNGDNGDAYSNGVHRGAEWAGYGVGAGLTVGGIAGGYAIGGVPGGVVGAALGALLGAVLAGLVTAGIEAIGKAVAGLLGIDFHSHGVTPGVAVWDRVDHPDGSWAYGDGSRKETHDSRHPNSDGTTTNTHTTTEKDRNGHVTSQNTTSTTTDGKGNSTTQTTHTDSQGHSNTKTESKDEHGNKNEPPNPLPHRDSGRDNPDSGQSEGPRCGRVNSVLAVWGIPLITPT